ncbi:MAG: hypothetical protein VCD00_06805 [Candidatus Hydrogenedentota bacterium]
MNTPEESRAAEVRRKRIWYIAVPILSALVMVLMYFSGIPVLRQIITPTIEGIYGNSQREFGLLENLQNVLLLTMVIFAIRGAVRKEYLVERVAFGGLACFALFVFLEEIDYGLHFYEYARGIQSDEAAANRNLHNVGDRTSTIKRVVDLGMFVLFVVLPFGFHKSRNRYLRYLAPDRYSVFTLLGSVLVSQFAHFLNDRGFGDAANIGSNISEFREYVTYWLFLLYIRELVFRRNLDDPPAESIEAAASTEP